MLGILLAVTFKSGDGLLRCLGVGNKGGRMAWVWFFIEGSCGVDDSKCKVMCIMHGEEIKKSWVSAGDSI